MEPAGNAGSLTPWPGGATDDCAASAGWSDDLILPEILEAILLPDFCWPSLTLTGWPLPLLAVAMLVNLCAEFLIWSSFFLLILRIKYLMGLVQILKKEAFF